MYCECCGHVDGECQTCGSRHHPACGNGLCEACYYRYSRVIVPDGTRLVEQHTVRGWLREAIKDGKIVLGVQMSELHITAVEAILEYNGITTFCER